MTAAGRLQHGCSLELFSTKPARKIRNIKINIFYPKKGRNTIFCNPPHLFLILRLQ